MRITLLALLILLYGCGSSEKDESASKTMSKEDKEFSWIENSDFRKVKEIDLINSEDLFHEVAGDDSLSTESISRLPRAKIEKIATSSDPVSRGIGKCYGKDFKAAESIFSANYKKYKNNPSYWNQIGTCQFLKGEYRKALLFYNKARALKPGYAPPVNNIGVIHQRQGNDQKALAAFKKAVELNKFSLTPVYNLAQLYLKYGFVKRAEKIFLMLYRKNSSDVDVVNALGTGSLLKGDYSKSVEYFTKLSRDKLSDARYGLSFSIALKKIGRVKDAKAVFSRIDTRKMGSLADQYNKVGRFLNE